MADTPAPRPAPRVRVPRTFVDVADLLDKLQHARPYRPAAQLVEDVRRDLESLAVGAIGRDPATRARHDQAGDLVRIGWAIRRSVWQPGRPLDRGFADMWAARHEDDRSLASCAVTLRLLVAHMVRHAEEVPDLLDGMRAVCPANLPREDVFAIAADTAVQWRAVLAVTDPALDAAEAS